MKLFLSINWETWVVEHKTVCATNYIEHFLILVCTITGCSLTCAFPSLIDIGIVSSAITLKLHVITAGIKKYKSIIKKNKIRYNKIVLY